MMSIFTKGTQHVYTGVKSAIVYDVKIKPTCEASHEQFKRNISAWPAVENENIHSKESENLTLICPFHGAHRSSKVILWEHVDEFKIDSVLRKFTASQITLSNLSYMDRGRYYCTVKFFDCTNSSSEKLARGFISVSLRGPPTIVSTEIVKRENSGSKSLRFTLHVISFPHPNCTIAILQDNQPPTDTDNCKQETSLVSYKAYGKTVSVPGYVILAEIGNLTKFGFQESLVLHIVLSNNEGIREYEMPLQTKEVTTSKNNKGDTTNRDVRMISYTTGSVFLLGLIIVVTFVYFRKKKHAVCRYFASRTESKEQEEDEEDYEHELETDEDTKEDYTPLEAYEEI
uniref:Uncharacterized protein LOC111127428 n=1 Tax=Crassostrea virginica TaxID=6565 RepID=A0A8B8DKP6_CRAVI|nr:uncharacterized protein LOC111127428 [Crassostrea virginica]